MSNRDKFDNFNDQREIYGKEPHKKKKSRFKEGAKIRDFKREYTQERDREDINFDRRYR